jgi:hypothetical protein
MAQIILSGDGMTINIDDEIARSDELLKRALSPHYPDLANALISRDEKDGLLKVTVSKRAGPKGSYPFEPGRVDRGNTVVLALEEVPPHLNPALALAWHLYSRSPFAASPGEGEGEQPLEMLLALQEEIEQAISEGESEASEIKRAVELLKIAPSVPSRRIPEGF